MSAMRQNQNDGQYEQFLHQFVTHRHQIYMFIFVQVGNRPDAEDIFQDVSSVLWRKFDQFELGTNFLAWARQVARNIVMNYRRQRARNKVVPLDEQLVEALMQRYNHVQDQIEDRIEALHHCITKLDTPNRDLVQMLYDQSLPVRHVADSLGVSVQRVYQRIGTIHDRLLRCVRQATTVQGS